MRQKGSLNSKTSNSLAQQALIAHKKGNLAKAQTLYRRSLRLEDADNESVLINLGVISKQMRDFSLAEQCYKKVLRLNTNNLSACINISSLCLSAKRYQESKEYSLKGLKISGISHECLYHLGVSNAGLGDYNEAITILTRCILEKPEFPPAYLAKATIHSEQEEYDLAQQTLQMCIKHNPVHAKAYEEQARLLSNIREDYSGALENLKEASTIDPKNHNYKAEITRLSYLINNQ